MYPVLLGGRVKQIRRIVRADGSLFYFSLLNSVNKAHLGTDCNAIRTLPLFLACSLMKRNSVFGDCIHTLLLSCAVAVTNSRILIQTIASR